MLRRVYIKRAGGEIASEACYAAWRGFSAKGYPLDFFEWQDLKQGCLVLDAKTLVVGGTTTVHMALRQIGIEPPPPLNIPKSLASFAKRRIWRTTLGTIRAQLSAGSWSPCFIKPLTETKSFVGTVVTNGTALERLAHLPDETQLAASEQIQLVSEWRYFVHHAAVVAIAHYAGNWALVPVPKVIEAALTAYTEAPVAYVLDFGITGERETVLVEANDAFALGAHGIDPVAYSSMLEDRWLQITKAGKAV